MEHIRVSKVERVKMMDRQNPKNSPMGKLYVTTSHLIFIKDDNNQVASRLIPGFFSHLWLNTRIFLQFRQLAALKSLTYIPQYLFEML